MREVEFLPHCEKQQLSKIQHLKASEKLLGPL